VDYYETDLVKTLYIEPGSAVRVRLLRVFYGKLRGEPAQDEIFRSMKEVEIVVKRIGSARAKSAVHSGRIRQFFGRILITHSANYTNP
jgi:hypothetical protein